MLDLSIIFIILNSIGSFFGLLVNFFLLYIAGFHSPKIIKTYSIILINISITNIGACISGFLIQQRIIQDGKSLFFASYGFCRFIGDRFCFDVFAAYLHFHTNSLWLIFLSFAYRYFVILKHEPKKFHLQISIILIYIPSLIQFSGMLFQKMDLSEIRNSLNSKFPNYNFSFPGIPVTGTVNFLEFAPLYTLVHMTIISFPIAFGIQIFRQKIIKVLLEKGVDLTSKSRNLHAQLLRTLTFQATVPLIYFLDVFIFFINHIFSHPIFEFSIIIPSLIVPILNPLSSLIYVKSYRNHIIRFFNLKSKIQMVSSQSILPVVSAGILE